MKCWFSSHSLIIFPSSSCFLLFTLLLFLLLCKARKSITNFILFLLILLYAAAHLSGNACLCVYVIIKQVHQSLSYICAIFFLFSFFLEMKTASKSTCHDFIPLYRQTMLVFLFSRKTHREEGKSTTSKVDQRHLNLSSRRRNKKKNLYKTRRDKVVPVWRAISLTVSETALELWWIKSF